MTVDQERTTTCGSGVEPRLVVRLLVAANRLFKAPKDPARYDSVERSLVWQAGCARDTDRRLAIGGTADLALDVGCGTGGKSLQRVTAGAARRVVGLDVRFAAVAQASRTAADSPVARGRVTFLVGSAESLPFRAGLLGRVYLDDVLEHVCSPEVAIREALRVLRTGGQLSATFPPFFSPYGSHLGGFLHCPWLHVLLGRRTLEEACSLAWARGETPLRRSGIGPSYIEWMAGFRSLNHLSIRRCRLAICGLRGARLERFGKTHSGFARAALKYLPVVEELAAGNCLFVLGRTQDESRVTWGDFAQAELRALAEDLRRAVPRLCRAFSGRRTHAGRGTGL